MLSLGWKKFSFFEQSLKSDHEFPEATSCCCQGADVIVAGCTDGSVALLDRNLRIQQAFQAHAKSVNFVVFLNVSLQLYNLDSSLIKCTHQPLTRSHGSQREKLLITLGVDEGTAPVNLKVWNLEGQPKSSTAVPPCLRSLRLFTPKQPEGEVTALAVHEESWPVMTIAAGLTSGSVYVLRGDIGVHAFTVILGLLFCLLHQASLSCLHLLTVVKLQARTRLIELP